MLTNRCKRTDGKTLIANLVNIAKVRRSRGTLNGLKFCSFPSSVLLSFLVLIYPPAHPTTLADPLGARKGSNPDLNPDPNPNPNPLTDQNNHRPITKGQVTRKIESVRS